MKNPNSTIPAQEYELYLYFFEEGMYDLLVLFEEEETLTQQELETYFWENFEILNPVIGKSTKIADGVFVRTSPYSTSPWGKSSTYAYSA